MTDLRFPGSTQPLGRGQRFIPLPSAKRLKSILSTGDMRQWMADAPGETYANEVVVNPSGAWPNVALAPPAPLVELLRVTIPRPEPVSISFHPWFTTDRFRNAVRMYAQVQSINNPAIYALEGRIFIEWGVGKARNWTYVDAAPGALHIINCTWVNVSCWTNMTPIRVAATAQVGIPQAPLDATWSQMIMDNLPGVAIVNAPPHYARDVTGYFYGAGLAAEGHLYLQDSLLNPFQEFLMRSAVTPNPQVIPYPPVRVPLAGGVAAINSSITVPGLGFATCTAVCTIRI